MVKDEETLEFCAIMNLAHFYTWQFFHEKFGIDEFPWKRAFFDDINIRHCICKEADEDLYTISNPVHEPTGEKITIGNLISNNIFEKLSQRK